MTLPESLLAFARIQPEATLLLSRGGRVLFANAAARDALALVEEQPNELLTALTADGVDEIEDCLRMWGRSTEFLPGAFRVQRRSSAEPIIYRCKGALLAPQTTATEAVIVCRFEPRAGANPFVLLNQTITELTEEVRRRREADDRLRASEASLRERADEAEHANRIKDEFLAALSHELRTPLNAILGWTIMLRQGLDEARRKRAIDTIERNTRAQVQLIEELLDVSRIVTGKLRLNVQQLDLAHVTENALDSVRPTAEARAIRIHSVLDPLAGAISGDPDRLQQVIWNLLLNAVKFTPKGGRVEVLLERIDSSVELTVTDTGQGIAPEFLPFVFDRFRQADGSTARTHGGLGLGLAIAKSIVELHGGTIRAYSDGQGKGATFVVRIPRAVVVRSDRPSRPFTVSTDPLRREQPGFCPPEIDGLRVVAVDDEPDGLQLLATVLDLCGAKVRTARNAAEALHLIQSVRPDVLISDIGMPGGDGYELIQKVRALSPPEGGRVRAIALTAFARAEDRRRALTAGFDAHVPKPVEPDELLAVLASVVRR